MPISVAAIVFDLDGTLLDSLDDIADTTNDALAAHGLPTHPVDAYRYFVGDGIQTLLRRAAPQGTSADTLATLVDFASKEYDQHWSRKTRLYEGIAVMLQKLEQRGMPMAVLSNKPHAFTCSIVSHFFPATPFTTVLGSPPGGKAKPDPTLALQVAGSLGQEPGRILFMGDTLTDMQTACNAGMIPAGVLWGFRPKSELVEHGARILLEHPNDLFHQIEQLASRPAVRTS